MHRGGLNSERQVCKANAHLYYNVLFSMLSFSEILFIISSIPSQILVNPLLRWVL